MDERNSKMATQLGAGRYVFGEDIPAGKYNLIAISGEGVLKIQRKNGNTFQEEWIAFGVADSCAKTYYGLSLPKGQYFEVTSNIVFEIVESTPILTKNNQTASAPNDQSPAAHASHETPAHISIEATADKKSVAPPKLTASVRKENPSESGGSIVAMVLGGIMICLQLLSVLGNSKTGSIMYFQNIASFGQFMYDLLGFMAYTLVGWIGVVLIIAGLCTYRKRQRHKIPANSSGDSDVVPATIPTPPATTPITPQQHFYSPSVDFTELKRKEEERRIARNRKVKKIVKAAIIVLVIIVIAAFIASKLVVANEASNLKEAENLYLAGDAAGAAQLVSNCNLDAPPYDLVASGDYAAAVKAGLTTVVIPKDVAYIPSDALYYCSDLAAVVIPEGVKRIGARAFYHCSGLKSIELPDGLTHIDNEAFRDCSGLTSIVIPDSVTSIGDSAFCLCENLSSVVVPNGITRIGKFTFYKCSSLNTIFIPGSVTSIGNTAFFGCLNLSTIQFGGTVSQWKSISKGDFWNKNVPATEVICSDGVVKLEQP